jgi:hypothetical protein
MTVQSGPDASGFPSADEAREEGFDHYRDDYDRDDYDTDSREVPLWPTRRMPRSPASRSPQDFTSVLRAADPSAGQCDLAPQPDLIDCVEFLRSLHRPIDPAVAALPPLDTAPSERQAIEWEYKIVRAKRPLFANPVTFAQLCREEALAGWILLEKFDDRRVRFRRPLHLRDELDLSALPFDPYRTQYQGPGFRNWGWGIAALLAAVTIPAYAGYAWVSVQLLGPWRDDLPRPAQRVAPAPPLNPPAESVHELPAFPNSSRDPSSSNSNSSADLSSRSPLSRST